MTTCRDILTDALGALGLVGFGGQPSADEIDGGLFALSRVVFELHGARGALRSVDVSADYLASENESVRIEANASVVVTLPNSVLIRSDIGGDDYFVGSTSCYHLSVGSSAPADGCLSRPPRDGARIEIVGTTQALYFYRSDTNAWVSAAPLMIDGPTPMNARYDGALAALVAERLCDPMNVAPSPTLLRRIARGNAALLIQHAWPQSGLGTAYL